MGICCSKENENYNAIEREYVIDPIEETCVQFYTLSEIEESIKSQFGHKEIITREDYLTFLTFTINKEKVQDMELATDIFTSLAMPKGSTSVSIAWVYLSLMPIIDNNKDTKNMYDIFVRTAENRLTVDSFYQILYITLMGVIVTLSTVVGKRLEMHLKVNHDIKKHFDMFTVDNFKLYMVSLCKDLLMSKPLENMNYNRFNTFFGEKQFLFSFKDIRHNFIEFLHSKKK
jgi:hypothetical protein